MAARPRRGPHYRIDRTNPENFCIRANTLISAGSEIVAEEPLAELEVSLTGTFNPTSLFNSDSPRNGIAHLEKLVHNLSQKRQQRLHRLRGGGTGSIVDVFKMNSFDESVEDSAGQRRTTIRLYDTISRFNHSCRPNAMLGYNPSRAKGSIRALRQIATDEEIVIDYMSDHDTSFKKGALRRTALFAHWSFYCDCSACHEQQHTDDSQDDTRRVAAAKFWRTIEKNTTLVNETEEMKSRRLVGILRSYIAELNALQINDWKLAEAYMRLTVRLKHIYECAKTFRPNEQTDSHCETCVRAGNARAHLNEAFDAAREAHRLRLRCFGPNHDEVEEAQNEVTGLLAEDVSY